MFILKKMISIIMICAMVMGMSATAFAGTVANKSHLSQEVFYQLIPAYVDVTGVEKRKLLDYYDDIIADEGDNYGEDVSHTFIELEKYNLFEKIIFIQTNYATMTENLSMSEKENFDKYLLDIALQYYYENPEEKEYLKTLQINNDEPTHERAAYVAKLTIYADPSDAGFLGDSSGLSPDLGLHGWIALENISSGYQRLGAIDFWAGTGVTVGTYGNTQPRTGMYYGLEGRKVALQRYGNRYSLSMYLTLDQLNEINSTITSPHMDRWSLAVNCATTAGMIWNTVATQNVTSGLISCPKGLADSIKSKSGYSYNATVPNINKVFYGGQNPIETTNVRI